LPGLAEIQARTEAYRAVLRREQAPSASAELSGRVAMLLQEARSAAGQPPGGLSRLVSCVLPSEEHRQRSTSAHSKLEDARSVVRQGLAEARIHFDALEARLQTAPHASGVLARLSAERTRLETRANEMERAIAEVSGAMGCDTGSMWDRFPGVWQWDRGLGAVDDLESLRTRLSSWGVGRGSGVLSADLTYVQGKLQPGLLPTESIVPAYLAGGTVGFELEDTTQEREVELSSAIKAKAESLGSAKAAYDFVRNELRLDWYYGSLKGATETLREGRGNDADLAALLVALLRAQGTPARFVEGTIELSEGKLADLLGLLTQEELQALYEPAPTSAPFVLTEAKRRLVLTALGAIGVPFEPVVSGGRMTAVRLSHIWVEAYLPFADYRGAGAARSGRQWVPLEPSISGGPKYVATLPALDPLSAMGANAESLTQTYLQQGQGLAPLVFWRNKVTEYLTGHSSGLSYDEVLRKVERKPEALPLLPGALPYRVVSVQAEHPFLPEERKHRLHITAHDGAQVLLDVTLPMHLVVGHRAVFTYKPASAEDKELIASSGGLYNAPASVVELRATFRLDGVERAVATQSVGLGTRHRWALEMLLPDGSKRRVENEIIAGNQVAIGLGAPFNRYLEPSPKPPGALDSEATAFLYQRAVDYVNAWTESEEALASLTRVVPIRPTANLVLVENQLQVKESFGIRQKVEWKGLEVDADLRSLTPLELGAGRGATLLRLSGYEGSFLEAKVLADSTGEEAVSAVTLLQEAHENGAQVLRIDPGNVGTELGKLQASPEVLADVSELVANGREVLIPKTPLTIRDWTGTGFIARDPETEEGGYFLSGRLSGGQTVVSPDSWMDRALADLLETNAPDSTNDTALIGRIIKVPDTDLQQGTVGEALPKEIAVYVTTTEGVPVRGASVTFQSVDLSKPKFKKAGSSSESETVTVVTNRFGRASVQAFPDTNIGRLGVLWPGEPHEELHGFNVVTAEVSTETGSMRLAEPIWFTAKPGPLSQLIKIDPTRFYSGDTGVEIGLPFEVKAADQYGNALANKTVTWLSDDDSGRFFVPETGSVTRVQFLGSDPEQQKPQLPLVTPTSGLVVAGFIPGTTPEDGYTAVTAQSGTVTQTFNVHVFEGGEFTFRLATPETAGSSGVFGAPVPKPFIVEILRKQDGSWTRVKGNEPEVRANVIMGRVTAKRLLADVKTTPPYALGSGATVGIDLDDNVVAWPTYDVENDMQETAFFAQVFKKEYGGNEELVCCDNRFVSAFYSGVPEVEVKRLRPGGTEEPLNPCGQLAPDDEALRLNLSNPGTFPIYAKIIQRPEIAGTELFKVPSPDVLPRDPVDVSRLRIPPNATLRIPLELTVGSGSGQAEVEFYAPDFRIGPDARTQLKKRDSYTFTVRKERGGVGSSARELRASIVLAVRNFAATRTPKDSEEVTPVRVPKPIFRPAHLPLCVNETGLLKVKSGTALIAGANVVVQEDGTVTLSQIASDVPLPEHPSNGALSVLVPPGDPSGQEVVVDFDPAGAGSTQNQNIPLITTVEDASALPVGHTFVKDVSTVDGHLVKQSVDLEVQGRAPGLQLVRSYTNRGHDGGPFGLGWTHSYRGYVLPSWDADLNVARYMVVGGEGTGQVFECKPGPTECVSQDGFHGTFRGEVEGSETSSLQILIYRAKNGTEYRYGPVISTTEGPRHQLLSVQSPTGQTLTFEYEGPGTDYEVGRVYEPGRQRFLQFTYERVSGAPRALLSRVELYSNPSAPNVLAEDASPEHLGICIAYLYNTRSMLAAVQRYAGSCPESLEEERTPLRQESYSYVDSPVAELRNNLSSWTDANNTTTSYVYYQPEDRLPGESDFLKFGNKSERVLYVNEPEGATTEFIYSLERSELEVFGSPITAFVTEVRGPRPEVTRSTRYYMGLDGTVARTERPLSSALTATTSSKWDPLHMRRDSETDARGRSTAFKYDAFGNLIERRISLAPLPASGDGTATESVKDGQDETKVHGEVVEKWSYDPAFSVPVCSMDAEGRITVSQLDSGGEDPRTGTPVGTGLVLRTRQYAQTVASGERTSTKTCKELAAQLSSGPDDIVQHRTWCKVEGVSSCPATALKGDLLETWIEGASAGSRLNHTRIAAYDNWGLPSVQVASVGASQEIRTEFVHNARGLKEKQTDTFGHDTEWEYDGLDRVKNTRRFNVKAAGGPHLSTPSPSIFQAFSYYPGGQLKSETNSSIGFERHYELDDLNRVKKVRELGNGLSQELVTTYEYDKAGNRTHVTDRRGVTTVTTYDWGDRPIQTSVRVLEGATRYGLQGGVNGSTHDVVTATFGYDTVGNKVYETNLHGQRTDYVLDSLYRVVRTRTPSVPGASFASVTPVRYEPKARYDLVGNPTKKTDGNAHLTRMAYDFANRLVSAVDAEGREERRTYDHAGNPKVIEKRTGSTVHLARTVLYDGLNRPVSVEEKYRHPNGDGTTFVQRERRAEMRYTDTENTVTAKDARGFVTTTVKDDLDRIIRVVVDDGSGKLAREPDEAVGPALALTTLRGYDGNGNLTTEVDPLGRKTTSVYDGLNRLLETHRPMGATETVEYDGEGAIIARVDARLVRREFTFDMFRRPVTERLVESLSNDGTPLEWVTRTYFDVAGPDGVTSVEEKDARGNPTRRYLDALRRELSVVDAKGKARAARYDAVNVREQRDRKGYRTLLRYDNADRLKAQDEEDLVEGSMTVKYRQSILYEDALQRETLTDRRGIPLVKQKDGLGRLVRTLRGTSSLQQEEKTEYNARDEVVAVIDANLHRKTARYDGAGRKVEETLGAGTVEAATTKYTYDVVGNLVARKGPRETDVAYDERNSFDDLNRLVRREDALGNVWLSAFDAVGNKLCEKRPLGLPALGHGQAAGMSLAAIQAAACTGTHVTRYGYDELGKLTAVTDARGGLYTYVYDKARNLVAKQDPNGSLTTYEYDLLNLRGAEHQHLDAHPRLSSREGVPGHETGATPEGDDGTLTWKWTYDANGNIETETDPKGQVTTSTHGALNRLVSRAFSGDPEREKPYVEAHSFDYDENGNLVLLGETRQTQAGLELKQTIHGYDDLDRLESKSRYYGGWNRFVKYGYDAKGNRKRVEDPNGVTTTYTYDALDRLKTAKIVAATTEYHYWPDGLLKGITYPNGVTEARCYDKAGRLSKQLTASGSIDDECVLVSTATLLSRSEYEYDGNGNRRSLKELRTNPSDQALGPEEQTEYGYDELDRLTGTRILAGKAVLYRLDAVGNRTGEREAPAAAVTSLGPEAYTAVPAGSLSRDVTYVLNRADWLRTSTDAKDATHTLTFGYDLNGNLVSKKKGVREDAITRTFAWDVRNTLTVVREGVTELGRYDYDANLQRLSRKTASEEVAYVLDDDFVLQELDAAQTSQPAKRRYHYAEGPLAVSDIAGDTNTRFLHTDVLGSVTEVTAASGAVSTTRKYDAWGGYRGGTAPSASEFKLGYTGHQYDPETGLIYARARYYDSDLGRFISRDSYEGQLGDAPSLHRYTYAHGNPLSYTDRSGHAINFIAGAIGAAVGGLVGCAVGAMTDVGCGQGAVMGAVGLGLAGLTMGTSLVAGAGMMVSGESLAGAGIATAGRMVLTRAGAALMQAGGAALLAETGLDAVGVAVSTPGCLAGDGAACAGVVTGTVDALTSFNPVGDMVIWGNRWGNRARTKLSGSGQDVTEVVEAPSAADDSPAGSKAGRKAFPFKGYKPSERMVGQEMTNACGLACARQLLKERGTDVPEATLGDEALYDPNAGTTAPNIARAMNKFEKDPNTVWVAKPVYPDEVEQQNFPYIAFVQGSFGGPHQVIIDRVTSKRIYMREPWGPQAEMSPESPGPGIGFEVWMDRGEYVWITRPGLFWAVTREAKAGMK
jgi:RHS repeat-associated protein